MESKRKLILQFLKDSHKQTENTGAKALSHKTSIVFTHGDRGLLDSFVKSEVAYYVEREITMKM
jgi:hypothetical protein